VARPLLVMAYAGDGRWIEADPLRQKVVVVVAPSPDVVWFTVPVTVLRWQAVE
jgi:hypothetical protein